MRGKITGRTKMIFSIMTATLFAVMVFAALPAADIDDDTVLGDIGDYNAGDIAVIQTIIGENGPAGWWPMLPGDSTVIDSDWMEENWPGVIWESDGAEERIIYLVLINQGLTGTLDVSGLDALVELYCSGNSLTGLDVSGCVSLTEMNCSHNNLATLDVSGCVSLEKLTCMWSNLASLDVSGCVALTDLYCSHNRLTGLDVSGLDDLEKLDCSYNHMTTESDVIGFTGTWDNEDHFIFIPQTISISEISGITVPAAGAVPAAAITETSQFTGTIMWLPSAGETFAHSTAYTARITIEPKTGFTFEGVPANFFTVAGATTVANAAGGYLIIATFAATGAPPPHHAGDIAVINNIIANNGLKWTPASAAQIAEGKIPRDWVGAEWDDDETLMRLIGLTLSGEDLHGDLDLTGLAALEDLRCYYNDELVSLDISGLKALAYVDCSFNGLTSLNVSGCTALEYLDCSQNELASLNVSGCTALAYLDCFDNKLTVLDVTGCPLTYLDCSENYLADESKVIGFRGTWDEEKFIFGSQKSLPDEGGKGFPILLAVAVVALIVVIAVVAYVFLMRPKK